jgi:multidrug efflux pump subunit AcrA (membrane-fusion protein)
VSLVPRSAIKTANGTSHVFLVRQNAVERRAVQTGGTDGDRVEVVAGLSAGDRVVVSPPDSLAEGKPVVIT